MRKINFALVIILLGSLAAVAQETVSKMYMAVSWSPDGKYLSFTEMQVTNSKPPVMHADIYIMKANASELKEITNGDGESFSPSWSK